MESLMNNLKEKIIKFVSLIILMVSYQGFVLGRLRDDGIELAMINSETEKGFLGETPFLLMQKGEYIISF